MAKPRAVRRWSSYSIPVLLTSFLVALLVLLLRFSSSGEAPPDSGHADRAAFVAANTNYVAYETAMEDYAATSATRESAPPAMVSAGASPDSAWTALPRTERFVQLIVERKVQIEPNDLLRNRDLNPLDTPISAKGRASIELAISRARADVEHLAGIARSVAAEEFSSLVGAGMARSITLEEYQARLTPAQKARHASQVEKFLEGKRAAMVSDGLSPELIERHMKESAPVAYMPGVLFRDSVFSTRVVDGKIMGATLDELPRAKEATAVGSLRLIEMASEIVSVFVAADCLSRTMADSLLARVADGVSGPSTTRDNTKKKGGSK